MASTAKRSRGPDDPRAVAFMLIGSLFIRAGQSQMIPNGSGADLPGPDAVLDALVTLLAPVHPDGPPPS